MKATVIIEILTAMRDAEHELKAHQLDPLACYQAYLNLSEARIKLQVHSGVNHLEIALVKDSP